mgnify:FL=1
MYLNHRILNSEELRLETMEDALDQLDDDSEGSSDGKPPLPPGLVPPPPSGIEMPPPAGLEFPPPPEIDLPPPMPLSQADLGISPDLSNDKDLLDAANSLAESTTSEGPESPKDFNSVWESRKTRDPSIGTSRDGIYGRINEIASARKDGTLMDRFSDRFGSELDKEIIILRKKEQDDLRLIKPTVELISAPAKNDEMTFDEFVEAMADDDFVSRVSEATGVPSDRLTNLDYGTLNTFFEKADSDKSGTLDFPEFVTAIQSYRSLDEDFSHFFNVINSLLGELPDELTTTFVESDSFQLFREVGEDPEASNKATRTEFFVMINELLGDLPETVMQNFIQSPDFDLYKLIAERYGGE